MSQEFKDCLKRRKITEFDGAKGLFDKELSSAKTDLLSAKNSLKDHGFKWSIVQSYYSMFHSARALVYSRGYRERSHYCLIIAVRTLFVQEGLVSHKLIEALQLGKTLRENADYYGDFSAEAAQQMIKDAEEFLKVAKELTKQVI